MKMKEFVLVTSGPHTGRYGFVNSVPTGQSSPNYHYLLFGGRCITGPAEMVTPVAAGSWLDCRYRILAFAPGGAEAAENGGHVAERHIVAHTDSLEAAAMIIRDIPPRDRPVKGVFDKQTQQYLEVQPPGGTE